MTQSNYLTHRLCTTCAGGVFTLLFLTGIAFGDKTVFSKEQALIAMGLCTEMVQRVNTLVDYTETKCTPSLADAGTDFIFVTEKPVFLAEASKKAWVIVVVAAVGKALNDNPSYRADKIFVADIDMAKALKYYAISTSFAKKLQKEVYDRQTSVEIMWSRITSAWRLYTGPTH